MGNIRQVRGFATGLFAGRRMKLSICVPTYNRALHLRNCLNSIVSNWTDQRRDIEICVSDNGSNDETSQVVEEIEKKKPTIKVGWRSEEITYRLLISSSNISVKIGKVLQSLTSIETQIVISTFSL